jgi:hypothetical protein
VRTYPSNLFDLPRWPGGPHICIAANLPAFETVAAAKAITSTCEKDFLKETWTCSVCGMLHADYEEHSPSGSSSGNPREKYVGPSMLAAKALALQPKLEIKRP